MNLRLYCKPDVAEKPRAGIPSRSRRQIFESHCKRIGSPEPEMLSQVELERGVPVRPLADIFAV